MPVVKGCNLPDHLLYDVDNHIWFQEQGDGTVKLGMTTVATAMAGQLVAFTPKTGRAARSMPARAARRSKAASGSGPQSRRRPARSSRSTMISSPIPSSPTTDPYDKGWFIILKPTDWAAVKADLDARRPGDGEVRGQDADRRLHRLRLAIGCRLHVAAKPPST